MVSISLFTFNALPANVQNEIGPEGDKLIWIFLAIFLIGLIVFLIQRFKK